MATPDRQLVEQVQWRGRRGYYGHGYYGGPRYYGYRRHNGAAVAAGVIGGLALGAAIAGAAAAPPPPVAYAPAPVYGGADWIAYCSSKYRSFNPATGLYLGYDGQYHPCQ
ncbi:MAG: BA14K family protein [Pseudomonadota bacterium]